MDRSRLKVARVVNLSLEGRPNEATLWLFTYGDEQRAWITDVGGGNPQHVPRAELNPDGMDARWAYDGVLDLEVVTGEQHIDSPDGTKWGSVEGLASDSSFPQPVAEWRATGKVWLADAVPEWQAEKRRTMGDR